MAKVTAYVVYEIVAEFDDDGETELRSQAYDAVIDEAPAGEIVDVNIEEIVS